MAEVRGAEVSDLQEDINNSETEGQDNIEEEEEEEELVAPAAAKDTKVKIKTKGLEPKVKKTRPIAIPKDSASWFRARAKNPRLFKFTADGNLGVPELRGQAAKVINLPEYRQSTSDERIAGEQKRYDELTSVETEYDETLRQYKEALQAWRLTGAVSDVLKAQRNLTRLDVVRSRLRTPLIWTKEFKRLSIRDVLTDEFYQVKKLGYPVYALRMRSIPFEDLVRIGANPVAEAEEITEESEGEEEEEEEEELLFFNNPDEPEIGPLSPDTMIEFIYNSTKYNCPTQAYEGERLKTLGRNDIRTLLLKQRNPVTMRAFGAKVAGDIENPRKLWIEILKALTSQHPKFLEILSATDKNTLVYANPKEGRWGIGLSADDPLAMDKGSWKGPNVLGQAWQVIRNEIPKEEQEGGGFEAGFTDHGKTSEEAKRQRANVLKGVYRRPAVAGI